MDEATGLGAYHIDVFSSLRLECEEFKGLMC